MCPLLESNRVALCQCDWYWNLFERSGEPVFLCDTPPVPFTHMSAPPVQGLLSVLFSELALPLCLQQMFIEQLSTCWKGISCMLFKYSTTELFHKPFYDILKPIHRQNSAFRNGCSTSRLHCGGSIRVWKYSEKLKAVSKQDASFPSQSCHPCISRFLYLTGAWKWSSEQWK